MSGLGYDELKAQHRRVREAQPANLGLRLHRALSWLKRAELAEDLDGRFVFLWIAFNAVYAQEIEDNYSEQSAFKAFIRKICSLDREKHIDALIWKEFPGVIRVLLNNQYIFPAFWEFQRGKLTEPEWQDRFATGVKSANSAFESSDTSALLSIVLNRVYMLRIQIVHGGATWNGAVNRAQLRDCVNLMSKLVPLIIRLMMDNPETEWPEACFPVVND
jgi:hypothetical protein